MCQSFGLAFSVRYHQSGGLHAELPTRADEKTHTGLYNLARNIGRQFRNRLPPTTNPRSRATVITMSVLVPTDNERSAYRAQGEKPRWVRQAVRHQQTRLASRGGSTGPCEAVQHVGLATRSIMGITCSGDHHDEVHDPQDSAVPAGPDDGGSSAENNGKQRMAPLPGCTQKYSGMSWLELAQGCEVVKGRGR